MTKTYALGFAAVLTACCAQNVSAEDGHSEASSSGELSTVERIPELMDAFGVSGLAVTAVEGDQIVFTGGFGVTSEGEPYTSTTPCGLYSATKTIASLTYLSLSRDGLIDLHAPLEEYLDDAPDTWNAIPFYRLLNHTSGITMAVNQESFGDLMANSEAGNRDVYEMVRDAPLDYEPGQYSRYRQSGYAIAEVILEERLGHSFSSLAERYVTGPAGMGQTQHASFTMDNEPAFLMSAGGFRTTADDMAKLFLGINSSAVLASNDWKTGLLHEPFRFGDYSLGSLIENRDGILTVGHSGGGARANIRYAPDEQIGIMVCTDDRQNGGLAIQLARMFLQEIALDEEPALPMLVALSDYRSMSGSEVIAAYRRAEAEGDRFDVSGAEQLINSIGYFYVGEEKFDDAIAVLSLNTQSFPSSLNAHDSLGEALLLSGDRAGALAQYQQVLDLDPGNSNAQAMIAQILDETE